MVKGTRMKNPSGCRIVSVGKRRDGGTRYWCLGHKADATAKYGKRSRTCRAAHIPLITAVDTLTLDLDKYPGGVALWGAVPPVYDTTRFAMDRGVHVHARKEVRGTKEMDRTVRAVRLKSDSRGLPTGGIVVSELDAIYYMVAAVFGFEMKYVECSHCGHPHLDKDWFSVHPHQRHLCSGCGRHFRDLEVGMGNPICRVREVCRLKAVSPKSPKRRISIQQRDFPGGIQIWGSNPAFIWTSKLIEDEGIHIHAFESSTAHPCIDETYSEVSVDGIKLHALMVRTLMAQNVLMSVRHRIVAIACQHCKKPQFDTGILAFTPTAKRHCNRCHRLLSGQGRLRNTIANPLPAVLSRLAEAAPRSPQEHDLGLLSETL